MRTEQGDIVCRMRGWLRRGRAEGDRVADRVRVSQNADGSGNIEEVLPPKSNHGLFGRQLRIRTGNFANLDQVLLVFALREPDPKLRML